MGNSIVGWSDFVNKYIVCMPYASFLELPTMTLIEP